MEAIWAFGLFSSLVIKERAAAIVYNWLFPFIFISWRNSCVNFTESDFKFFWKLMKIVRWLISSIVMHWSISHWKIEERKSYQDYGRKLWRWSLNLYDHIIGHRQYRASFSLLFKMRRVWHSWINLLTKSDENPGRIFLL